MAIVSKETFMSKNPKSASALQAAEERLPTFAYKKEEPAMEGLGRVPSTSPNRQKIVRLQMKMQTLTSDLMELKQKKAGQLGQQVLDLELAISEHIAHSDQVFDDINDKIREVSQKHEENVLLRDKTT